VSDGALEGVTRAAVLEIARDLKLPAEETSLGPYDLYTADECFLAGTGAELIPVREVDGRKTRAAPGVEFGRIEAAFHALVRRETQWVAAAAPRGRSE
jgi:branched-chain amino acid aminotransferase